MSPIRRCSKDCPQEHCHLDITWHCFSCQEPMHLLCYGLVKKPEEIFLTDNIKMVCDECLANPKGISSPKRKQPNGSGNLVQRTIGFQDAMMALSKPSNVTATPPKSTTIKQNQQLQTAIEALVQKIDSQTWTIAGLQLSVDSMNGTLKDNTATIAESIKETRTTYADIAKKGVAKFETPRATKLSHTPKTSKQMHTPKSSKPSQTTKSSKPVITGTSTNKIGKPLSPPQRKRIDRPKPEKAIWISRIHRDTTEEELSDYIKCSIGIAPTEFQVRKLVKKDRDITTYSFVSFYVACTQENFNTLINPMYWPSNSQIREFELEQQPSTGFKLDQTVQGIPKNSQGTPNDNQSTEQSAMDTDQVIH